MRRLYLAEEMNGFQQASHQVSDMLPSMMHVILDRHVYTRLSDKPALTELAMTDYVYLVDFDGDLAGTTTVEIIKSIGFEA